MNHTLYILGVLAISSIAVLLTGFYVARNGFSQTDKSVGFAKIMFVASIVCVVSGTAWIIHAVITWWDVWIAFTIVGLLLLYVISPVVTQNHNGETLITWFGANWLKRGGVWVKM